MKLKILYASALALTLAACGGGGGSDPAPNPPTTQTNRAPVAVAGTDFSQSLSSSGTQFDGSGSSDPDGDTLSYAWSVVSEPAGASASFDDASVASPVLQTLVPGVYEIELSVSDGRGGSSSDTVQADLTNDAPNAVVDAIPAQIATGIAFTLNATGSSDANGHPLSFEWTVTSAPSSSNLRSNFPDAASTIELDVGGDF